MMRARNAHRIDVVSAVGSRKLSRKNTAISRLALVGAVIASLSLGAVACKQTAAKPDAKQGRGGKGSANVKYPVEAYPVESKRIAYVVTSPGTIDAFERVQVTARVTGAVDRVAFTEGQQVKKGDVLVVIDSERFQSLVSSAQAGLNKAQASEKDAQAMVSRREGASDAHPGLIPGEELATYQTKSLTAKADTSVAQEGVHAAQLNLRDATVRAPMDGVIQTRTIETGQYVQPGYVMATLLREEPMLLRFQVEPLDAPRIKAGMPVTFTMRETQRVFGATVTLVSGAADDASHMVGITAEVTADSHKYWLRPGSFCDVTMSIGGLRDAVVIPRAAVRPTERGFVAYVIDGAVAHEKVLQLGENSADGWVEVRSGLQAGDRLVTKGGEPLAEGSGVEVSEVAPPASSGFTPPPLPTPDTSASGAASAGPPPMGNAMAAPGKSPPAPMPKSAPPPAMTATTPTGAKP